MVAKKSAKKSSKPSKKRVALAKRRCYSDVAKKSSSRLAHFQKWKARKYPGKAATKSMYKEFCQACASGKGKCATVRRNVK